MSDCGMSGNKVFLANVGANATHRFESPVFPDGTFEQIPIIETPPEPGHHSVRMADVPSWNRPGATLSEWVPGRYRELAAHYDPEFGTVTYGDNCERAARAYALKSARPGDVVLFLARLRQHDGRSFCGPHGFYLTGLIEIESVLESVRAAPSAHEMRRYGANAHVRKGLNGAHHWDGFWVFGGSERSERFDRAVPVDRALCDAVFRTASGGRWEWPAHRTELQVIGSYTRTCRAVLDTGNPAHTARLTALSNAMTSRNPHAPLPGHVPK
jgi:hypothetical protein